MRTLILICAAALAVATGCSKTADHSETAPTTTPSEVPATPPPSDTTTPPDATTTPPAGEPGQTPPDSTTDQPATPPQQ